MVTINIQKKDLWLIAAVVVLLVGAGVVVAYNDAWTTASPNVASTHGHSPDELEVVVPVGQPGGTLKTGQMWIDPTP